MKRFISFSGGVESTTMCILFGKGATAIWCDTGAEHEEMYARIDMCEIRLKEIHNGDFELLRIKASVMVKEKLVDNLTEAIERWMYMPTKQMRWCTGKFKIIPIDNFLKSQGECELLIGLNAEEDIRTGNWETLKNVIYCYPLRWFDYIRDDCKVELIKYGLLPNFPVYMQRGGCKYCIFKMLGEWKAMYIFNPNEFFECLYLEERIQDKRKKFFAISMTGKSLRSIMESVDSEIRMFGIEEVKKMYKQVEQTQSCGVFCHR